MGEPKLPHSLIYWQDSHSPSSTLHCFVGNGSSKSESAWQSQFSLSGQESTLSNPFLHCVVLLIGETIYHYE